MPGGAGALLLRRQRGHPPLRGRVRHPGAVPGRQGGDPALLRLHQGVFRRHQGEIRSGEGRGLGAGLGGAHHLPGCQRPPAGPPPGGQPQGPGGGPAAGAAHQRPGGGGHPGAGGEAFGFPGGKRPQPPVYPGGPASPKKWQAPYGVHPAQGNLLPGDGLQAGPGAACGQRQGGHLLPLPLLGGRIPGKDGRLGGVQPGD